MFQYQEIFLAAAVIVIVGIGAVGVMLIRRGRRAAEEEAFWAAQGGAPAEAHEPVAPASAPALDASYGAALPAVQLDYLQGVEQLLAEWRAKHEPASADDSLEAAQSSQGARRSEDELAVAEAPTEDVRSCAMILADPLGAVILDMLEGKGKLAGAELKRLESFRPDRIDSAAQAFRLPTRLQGDENAALRLAQIQLYAATLRLHSKWSAQASSGIGGEGEAAYSSRDFRLKMARDIMNLPADDRAAVVGLLLGGLLGSPGSTPELKRAVIDTLEHLRSAVLPGILLGCLDDPDSGVREYALSAADRLLEG